MGTYSKTTFVAGGPPGISETELNKLGSQFDAVVGASQGEFTNILAMFVNVDTRGVYVTSRNSRKKVTNMEERNGATVLRSFTINYAGNLVSSVVEVANGKTITYTLNRDSKKILTSITKTVS